MSKLETSKSNWLGRSLKNYIEQHPKARGAKNLTQARAMAFGKKQKRLIAFREKADE